jgi:hypothetical protein
MKEIAKNGIVIVATGHPYYGRWAYNLAVSVKAVEDFPIALLFNDRALSHLSERQMEMFDEIIELPDEVPANQSAKLYSARFTPWENTLLLDADMLWLPRKKPSELFAELAAVDFTGITEGNDKDPARDYFFWADVGEIREKYGVTGDIYQWRSEVVYFSKKGKAVIERALEITNNPGLSTIKLFAHTVPDELGINIAAAAAGIRPHIYKWQPSYWHLMHRNIIPEPATLHENYYLISFGSNNVSGTIKKVYDQLMKAYCQRLSIQHIFSMESKRNFLKERDKI